MQKVILFIYLFTYVYTQVIYEYDLDVDKKTYYYRVETPDGTMKYERGHFELDPVTNEESLVVLGRYEYLGDNDLHYSVTYVADKNGYRPSVSFGVAPPFGSDYSGRGGAGGSGGYAGGYPGGAGEAPAAGAGGGKKIDPKAICTLIGSGC